MSSRRFAAVAALVLVAGCRDHAPAAVATLHEIVTGQVDHGRGDDAWSAATVGEGFQIGEAARTSADGGARLALQRGGLLRMGPSTVIRFGQGKKLAVDGEVATEDADAVLELDVGTAELRRGSKVRIHGHGDATRFEVLVGSATVVRDGKRLALTAGDGLDLEVGAATVTRVAHREADAGPAATSGHPAAPLGSLHGTLHGHGKARAPGEQTWRSLAAGDQALDAGTEVVLDRGATLELVRGDERALVHGAAEITVAPAGGALAKTTTGRTEVTATATDVVITVPGGRITARRGPGDGSQATVAVDHGAATVDALRGQVVVAGDGGGDETLELGESSRLDHDGKLAVTGRPPTTADFALAAGASAVIHDPAPPLNLRLELGGCAEAGVVELEAASEPGKRHLTRGKASAIVALDRGSYRYRVRCLADGRLDAHPVAEGHLVVQRDSGTRPLPQAAPKNDLDADGRRYTVLYQSLLPELTFRWPGAPHADRYELHLSPSKGKAQVIANTTPAVVVAGTKLREDTFTYWFTAGDASSKQTRLTIGFDNAAASGYLESPRPGAAWGDTVHVAGAAIAGWTVRVGERELPLDRQLRFSIDLPPPTGDPALAIEFSHPTRGRHFYLRRPPAH